ncbi:hypothetical protein [Thalassolituus oleivorans]|jgi:DeoR/GlpR family transcriptional regulator of sugar metabolism|uniref:hypothetical protein n=1 Tax=Thalassolituus oleivorans TaxID=187493 RepID=UPI0023F126C4|nr:hypothetical protein [Thalassolituus oleivorans]
MPQTHGQYQKVTKVSKATATRHLADLVTKGCVEKMTGGVRGMGSAEKDYNKNLSVIVLNKRIY